MNKSKIELSVIIVSYNTSKLTQNCLKSISQYLDRKTTEIIVVDNASSDGSREMLKQQRDILLIQNETNVGFSKANNQGSKVASGEYLFFLNSDTVLINDSINQMVNFLKSNKNVGLVSPKLLNSDLSIQPSCFPAQNIKNAIKEYLLKVPHSFSKYSPNSDKEISVAATVGAAMLIKKNDFEAAGRWNEKYFFYFEDLDLCRKVRKTLKKEIYYYPQASLIHLHGSSPSTGQLQSWKRLIPSSKIYHGILTHILIQGIIYLSNPYLPKSATLIKKLSILPLIIIIAIPFLPLLKSGVHNIQDDMQFIRVLEMKKCLVDHQIPCRWVPDLGYGYGYPLYNYYAPGPYYVGAALSLIFNISTIDTVKLLFIFGFILSFFAMYLFARSWLSAIPSILLSVVYLYLPTRMVQVYVRGSLGEFLSYALFPIIFWQIQNLIQKPTIKNVLVLSLANLSLTLTHNLMSVFFLPVQIFWAVFCSPQFQVTKVLKSIGISLAVGLLMSAFFSIPAVFESKYVHLETLTGGYFGYQQHFVTLKQLLFNNHFGYGSSRLGPSDDLYLGIGVVWLMSTITFIVRIIIKPHTHHKKVLFLNLFAFFIVFLVHERSSFIWEKIKLLQWLQFPWRLNVISSFLFTVATAYSLANIKPALMKFLIPAIFLVVTLVMYGNKFTPKEWIKTNDNELYSGTYYQKQLTSSIYDYLPKSAVLAPNKPAQPTPEILSGQVEISNYIKKTDSQEGNLIVLSPTATIRFPVYDYPGMEVLINNKVSPYENNLCLGQDYCFGLISVKLPRGTHQVKIKLTNTPVRSLSNTVSIVSLLTVTSLLIIKKTRNAQIT